MPFGLGEVFMYQALTIIHVVVALAVIGLVLLQQGRAPMPERALVVVRLTACLVHAVPHRFCRALPQSLLLCFSSQV
jgi:hypothetical protein